MSARKGSGVRLSFCLHLRRGFPLRDPQSGKDIEKCLDCGRGIVAKIQFGNKRLPATR